MSLPDPLTLDQLIEGLTAWRDQHPEMAGQIVLLQGCDCEAPVCRIGESSELDRETEQWVPVTELQR